MKKLSAVSTVILLGTTLPVSAYHVDKKQHTITLASLADFDKCQADGIYSDACLDGLAAHVKAHPGDAFAAGLTLVPASAQQFRGSKNEEVLLIRTAKKDKGSDEPPVLVKLKGISGAWNDRVLLTVETPQNAGKNYTAYVDGKEWVVVTEREGGYEAHPKGYNDPLRVFRVQLTDQRKQLNTADVVKEFASAPAPARK